MSSDPKLGIGNAPTRCTTLPTDSAARKEYPVATGFLDYFPDAVVAVANLSLTSNEQHSPGKPIHWDRNKSIREDDTLMRHFLQRGSLDTDGKRHSAKLAWRALALLQKEIEAEQVSSFVAKKQDVCDLSVNHHVPLGDSSYFCECGRYGREAITVKEGPYCFACNKLAELRSELTGTYFCRRCVNEDLGLYTVLDGGKQ